MDKHEHFVVVIERENVPPSVVVFHDADDARKFHNLHHDYADEIFNESLEYMARDPITALLALEAMAELKEAVEAKPLERGDVVKYRNVAAHVLGEPSDDGLWPVSWIGDDQIFLVDRSDLTRLYRDEFCGECGQVGCGHGR